MTDAPRSTTPERPPRLKVLADGTLELPLTPRREEDGTRTAREPVKLPEPNMVELAQIHDLVRAADDSMVEETGALPEIPPTLQQKLDQARRANMAEERAARAESRLAYTVEAELDEDDLVLIGKRAEVLKERRRVAFSEKSPHGEALLKVVQLLTGQTYTLADLPGWAMHWTVIGEVLARFQDPLAGRGAELVAEAMAAGPS